jgi:quinol-cytochrome oxidoreductase complex cytochrome b subunit
VLHIRPKYYQRASTWFTHTWRLGWLAVFLFVVETVTGIVLMVFYAPTPERAYSDMLKILSSVPFGPYMRDLHRLGAEVMVAVVVLHMVRVYFTGSYKGPRKFTWFTGVILLLLTLVLSFSGYLLPWDQLAYWAVTIGTSMAEAVPIFGEQLNLLLRGGLDIWDQGLLRFYLLHVVLLPLIALVFISVHYYKVAREHSISLPASVEEGDLSPEEKKHAEERIDLIPNLLIGEMMLVSLALFLMVLAVTTFFHAPLESQADPLVTPLHTEAPWYFLWLQGMLKLGGKGLMGIVLPTVIFSLLFVIPWIDRNPYRLASRRKFAVAMGIMFSIIIVILTYMGTPGYGIETPAAQDILSRYAPQTHAGPVRELPFDELEAGPDGARKTYFVSYPESWIDDPQYGDDGMYAFVEYPAAGDEPASEFHEILLELKADVESDPRLMAPLDNSLPFAVVTVENIQPDLKWVQFTISWDEIVRDPRTGEALLIEDPATGLERVMVKRDLKDEPTPDEQIAVVTLHREANYRE